VGRDTAAVLRDFVGLDEAEIGRLAGAGVIGVRP